LADPRTNAHKTLKFDPCTNALTPEKLPVSPAALATLDRAAQTIRRHFLVQAGFSRPKSRDWQRHKPNLPRSWDKPVWLAEECLAKAAR
jgi:hypothetical protein